MSKIIEDPTYGACGFCGCDVYFTGEITVTDDGMIFVGIVCSVSPSDECDDGEVPLIP